VENEIILGFFTRTITLFKRIYKDCEGWLKIQHNKGSMLKGLRLEVELILIEKHFAIATLALGLRPRQGLVRLRAKREARGSHFMFPGVQKNVRE